MRFVSPLLPNPMHLEPIYIEHLVDLELVLLESIPLNARATHVLLHLEYMLSLFFQSLFASRSPIVVLSLASLVLFDRLFYILLAFVALLSRLSSVSFVVVPLVHFELFVVLLSFLFFFSSLFFFLFPPIA
jgi:hypothetical protein